MLLSQVDPAELTQADLTQGRVDPDSSVLVFKFCNNTKDMRQIVWFGGPLNAVQMVKCRPFSPTLQKLDHALMQQFLEVLKMIIFR